MLKSTFISVGANCDAALINKVVALDDIIRCN